MLAAGKTRIPTQASYVIGQYNEPIDPVNSASDKSENQRQPDTSLQIVHPPMGLNTQFQ